MPSTQTEPRRGEEPKGAVGAEGVNPYGDTRAKGAQVEEMFDAIAPAYDFMNTAMTLGMHRRWRDRALRMAAAELGLDIRPDRALKVLDVATGTGDVAFRMLELWPGAHVTGIDLSDGMLEVGRRRLREGSPEVQGRLEFMQGDCLALPFADESFDLVTVAYGVRNFEHHDQGLREMARVTRRGGAVCIIELSRPVNPVLLAGYNLYTHTLVPTLGRLVSGDSRAYTYLPESIAAAPQRDALTDLMRQAGLRACRWKSLTLGAVCVYLGRKP